MTFQQQIFGVSRFAPKSVYRASLMRWLRKCTSLGWYFASVTSYKRCNLPAADFWGSLDLPPKSVYRASMMRWLRKCTSLGWYFASVTSYKRCNFLWPSSSRFLGSLDLPQNRYIGPPLCADYENVPFWGGILPLSQVTSVVTFCNHPAADFWGLSICLKIGI